MTGSEAALRAPPHPPWRGPLGEAVSFRAGSPGFGDILLLAEGGGNVSQLLRSPCCVEEAGLRVLGREDMLLPSGACTATSGPLRGGKCEQWVRRPILGTLAEGRDP